MAEIKELSSKNFDGFLKSDNVIVDFWAPWCGPCKMLAPALNEAAEGLKDRVKFGKVNIDSELGLAQRFQIMSIPALLFFQEKQLKDMLIGAVSKDEIIKKAKEAFFKTG